MLDTDTKCELLMSPESLMDSPELEQVLSQLSSAMKRRMWIFLLLLAVSWVSLRWGATSVARCSKPPLDNPSPVPRFVTGPGGGGTSWSHPD